MLLHQSSMHPEVQKINKGFTTIKKKIDFSLTRTSETNSIIQAVKVDKATGPNCIQGKFIWIYSEKISKKLDKIDYDLTNLNRSISEKNLSRKYQDCNSKVNIQESWQDTRKKI